MYLCKIVRKRAKKQTKLEKMRKEFSKKTDILEKEISKLLRLERLSRSSVDTKKIQIAENILKVKGDIHTVVDGHSLSERAIVDISNNFLHLKTKYFGNKIYEKFYQNSNCEYGTSPKHGNIVDYIGLINRDIEITAELKDACIYYLQAYDPPIDTFYFTFGGFQGEALRPYCVKINGEYHTARNEMLKKFGKKWAYQYKSKPYEEVISIKRAESLALYLNE